MTGVPPQAGSGLRPVGAEPQDASQAKPLVPNAAFLKIMRGLEEARNHAQAMDLARVYLGGFLARQGMTGQTLNRQASKVYDAAVLALVAASQGDEA